MRACDFLKLYALVNSFQSTLPHGERPVLFAATCGTGYFNPRSRMGSDATMAAIGEDPDNFNPRSRMGSDPTSLFMTMI